jgi:ankyrin repeat protein
MLRSAKKRLTDFPAKTGSTDAIMTLVNAGATVAVADKDGLTALHCASSRCRSYKTFFVVNRALESML